MMTSTANSSLPPLSVQYDDLVCCTNVLLPGIEGGEKQGYFMTVHVQVFEPIRKTLSSC